MPKRVKLIKKANQEVESFMLAMEKCKVKKAKIDEQYSTWEKELKTNMLSDNVEKYVVDDDVESDKFLQASVYERTDIKYNISDIEQSLSKDQKKQVSDSLYVVDQSGLKQFIKQHPELKTELKQFISKVSAINEQKLGLAIDHGLIDINIIKPHIQSSVTPIFKLQRVKRYDILD